MKTKHTKKNLAALLTVLMLLTISVCFVCFAADESGGCGSGLTWTYSESTRTLTINGTGAMNDYKATSQSSVASTDAPWYSHYAEITRVSIGNGVTKIGNNAFRRFTQLTQIEIPNSVETLGNYAFGFCTSLVSADFGTGLKSIGAYAFTQCTALKTFIIPDSAESVADYAFFKCPVTDLVLGQNVNTIGSFAFSQCKLVNVTMHKNVEVIGESAFAKQNGKATDVISHVYYSGTEADWNNIIIGQNNEPLTGAQLHFSSTQQPHTHSYTSSATKAATCTEAGVRTYSCSCGDSYTETISIDPNAHATLNENGDCPRCGKHVKDVEQPTNPSPEQPAEKLNFFQRIIQWFRNLFARLFGR